MYLVVMINVNTILMYVVHKKTLNLTLTQQLDILILDVLCFLRTNMEPKYKLNGSVLSHCGSMYLPLLARPPVARLLTCLLSSVRLLT